MKLKVIQLNIWRGQVLDNAVEFFKKEDPDIITLQEVYDGKDKTLASPYRTFEYLQETFPNFHAVYSPQFGDLTTYGQIEEGNAIFSKFPIVSHDTTFFDIPYGTFDNHAKTHFDDNPQSVLHGKLDVNGIEVNVFCVHGIWGYDGKDSARRLKMADTLLAVSTGVKNVIMTGDFNMDPDNESANKIAKNLVHVFGSELTSTFNMKHKKDPGFAKAAVDMMFVSPNIKVMEKESPNVDVSDHLPLVATLEV